MTWQSYALLSAVCAALLAIFAKIGVGQVSGDFATFLRTVVILVVLAGLLTVNGGWQPLTGISPGGALWLVLSGLATGASWVFYFRALRLGPASQVAPIDRLSVVLVAVFATAFLGERLSVANWAGIMLIGAGAVLVALR